MSKLPDIIVLQETHLVEKYCPKLVSYTMFRADRTIRSGGLAIFVKENLSTSKICTAPSNSGIEFLTVRVNSISICNVYMHPDHQMRGSDLAFFDQLSARTIVVGDFNAHHWSWSHTTDSRGRGVFDAINRNNFVLLNDSTPTRLNLSLNAVNRGAILDLSIASDDIAWKCKTTVSDQLIGSDHYVVFTTLNERFVHTNRKPPKWSLKKADWPGYSNRVDCNLHETTVGDVAGME